jgi:lysophosphatidate acyltransferase
VARIRVTNAFGVWIGRWAMACVGCRVSVSGQENIGPDRPAIYACNHTSLLDAFTTIWLTPAGTVGVAKKEVLFYPFYGQAWWLAGHVFLDRGQTDKGEGGAAPHGDLPAR